MDSVLKSGWQVSQLIDLVAPPRSNKNCKFPKQATRRKQLDWAIYRIGVVVIKANEVVEDDFSGSDEYVYSSYILLAILTLTKIQDICILETVSATKQKRCITLYRLHLH